ncbi:hypothetical protein [Limimaricola soesokkakensis]|uniref:hypothetical protein n=1 Tax=Limimaricola soesokkakensis TaxID=1343159 RepID=UPI0010550133|nr:hypothetical protein [Limimaricola soesokkakensis]
MLRDLTWNNTSDIDVKRLSGKHRLLVRGNHDKQVVVKFRKWARVCDYLGATVLMPDGGKRTLVLSHYPMASWVGARYIQHPPVRSHAWLGAADGHRVRGPGRCGRRYLAFPPHPAERGDRAFRRDQAQWLCGSGDY